ncbi:permease [Priestia aryabhattai]|uniref:permease n=1 Tax=Priestia aryabhattai TaxID=412384 RepID=UPI001C0B27F3|nr:permease [Priestia aryabhattai]MBU3570015.1 permease [Priestia aryabhattai]WDL87812.1 permease [Priestia aryabhattai]
MTTLSQLSKDLIGVLLLMLFGYCFFFVDINTNDLAIPASLLNVNSIFLSIVLEAIPFILLGVFASALIQVFVSEEFIQRLIPKNPYIALLPAVLVSALLPVCECAIIPVIRQLLKKGMPLHIGIVILVGAPILNPVVFAATFYAFQSNTSIVYSRMGLAAVACLLIGLSVYVFFKNSNQLRHVHVHEHEKVNVGNKLKQTLYHASDEFFDMGKYLLFGALVASLFQTFLDRQLLTNLASNDYMSSAVMMGFAYVLSLCSEADAFVASSFSHTFSPTALLAFLLYGPMMDFKNTIMLLSFFKKRFACSLILIITVIVYLIVMTYGIVSR